MPDHIHFIIRVTKRLPDKKSLGIVLRGFKQGCNKQLREISQEHPQQQELSLFIATEGTSLFEDGYNDRPIFADGQLQTLYDYILENPLRLALKRAFPNFFRQRHNINLHGTSYTAIGNLLLLSAPERIQVKCHRKITPEDLERQKAWYLEASQRGAVLVSPCISEGEKAIMKAAREAHRPIIVLLENGFSEKYKPSGPYLDAITEGRLLMLAPWPHHNTKCAITRQQCEALNAMTSVLCTDPGLYEGLTMNDDEALRSPRHFCVK